jgi:hypothetical protein
MELNVEAMEDLSAIMQLEARLAERKRYLQA